MRVNLCVWGKETRSTPEVLESTFYVERLISKKRDNGKSVSIYIYIYLAVARQSPIYLFIYIVHDLYNVIQN